MKRLNWAAAAPKYGLDLGASTANCASDRKKRTQMRLLLNLAIISIMVPAFSSYAFGQNSDYVVFSEQDEIALARTAAPSSVSAHANIWVLRDGRYFQAVNSTSGNACMVARTYERSVEPICFGPEAARTMMLIDQRRVELRLEGKSQEEIDGIIEGEIGSGVLMVPRRPTMAYMMSSEQHLFDPTGGDAGNWKPHMHVFMPYLTMEEMGLSQMTSSLMVDKEGEPTASAIIILPGFTDAD